MMAEIFKTNLHTDCMFIHTPDIIIVFNYR